MISFTLELTLSLHGAAVLGHGLPVYDPGLGSHVHPPLPPAVRQDTSREADVPARARPHGPAGGLLWAPAVGGLHFAAEGGLVPSCHRPCE